MVGGRTGLFPWQLSSIVEALANQGIAEVVLTGVDVASWGGDLEGHSCLGN